VCADNTAHATLDHIALTPAAEARRMILRTRMMLKCPGCDEPKLMSVTIIDDVAGPALCDSCIAHAKLQQRQAAEAAQGMRSTQP
jgi:hypothetical protein